MSLYIVLVSVLVIVVLAFRRGHYLLGLSNVSVALYELSALVFHDFGGLQDLIPLMWRYEAFATDQNTHDHLFLAVLFLATLNLAYLVVPFLFSQLFKPNSATRNSNSTLREAGESDFRHYYALIALIFAFGVMSFLSNAGSQMLNDYTAESDGAGSSSVTVFFWYGTLLITCCAPLASFLYSRRMWVLLGVIVLAMLPMLFEVFISSRRQFIAPILVFFLLQYLYQFRSQYKYLYVFALLLVAALVLGAQASMRTEFSGELTEASFLFALPFAAQFNEFVAAGTTTLSTLELIDEATYTWFGHFFVVGFANSIPYVKLGNIGFPEYIANFQMTYKQIAPIGGFSTIGEAYLSLGTTGVAIVAAFAGALARLAHGVLSNYFSGPISLRIHSTYVACLTCILLLKYRSGFTDAYMAFVNFSFFYYFIVLFQFALFRRTQFAVSMSNGRAQI